MADGAFKAKSILMGKDSLDSSQMDEAMGIITKNTLRVYERLIKVAVGHALVDTLTHFSKKKSPSFTLDVSRLELDKSPLMEDTEENRPNDQGVILYIKFVDVINV